LEPNAGPQPLPEAGAECNGAEAGGSRLQAFVGHWTWHAAAPGGSPPTAPRRPTDRRDRPSEGHAPSRRCRVRLARASGASPSALDCPARPTRAPWAGCSRARGSTVPSPRCDAPARTPRRRAARPRQARGARRAGGPGPPHGAGRAVSPPHRRPALVVAERPRAAGNLHARAAPRPASGGAPPPGATPSQGGRAAQPGQGSRWGCLPHPWCPTPRVRRR
jgi:hypothetical protein